MPHSKWDRGVLHPLSWTHREENGEKPNNLSSAHKRTHQYHKQLLVSGETHFTPVPFHPHPQCPWQKQKPPPGTSPAQETLNFVVSMQFLLKGVGVDQGQLSFPSLKLLGQWARTETRRATQGSSSTLCPHPGGGRCQPVPQGAGALLPPPAQRSFRLLSRGSRCCWS